MGITPRELLRRKGTPYDELGLDDPKWTDDELIDQMLAHPILINRPIVVDAAGRQACAGRPRRSWTSCQTRSAGFCQGGR